MREAALEQGASQEEADKLGRISYFWMDDKDINYDLIEKIVKFNKESKKWV
jgi:hypothetical protein